MEKHHLDCDPRVIGIAFVVEEIGKGSKLVFKYPLSPSIEDEDETIALLNKRNDSNASRYASGETTGSRMSSSSSNISSNSYLYSHSSLNNANRTTKRNSSKQKSREKGRDHCNNSNIFFRLKARILAKLFRTKPALCGQPVSLNIEGTVFCCRSVLLNPNHSHHHHHNSSINVTNNIQDDNISVQSKLPSMNSATSYGSHTNNTESSSTINTVGDGLVLFSIIVAMKPIYLETNINSSSTAAMILSINQSCLNHHHRHQQQKHHDNHRVKKHGITNHSKSTGQKEKQTTNNNSKSNTSCNTQNNNNINSNNSHNSYTRLFNHTNEHKSLHFEAVRRIHLTLSRLCKVLEREEKRCLYVSRQVSHLLKVSNAAESASEILNGGTRSIDKDGVNNSGGTATVGDGGGSSNNNCGGDNSESNMAQNNIVGQTLSSAIDINDNPIANAIGMYSSKSTKQDDHDAEEEEQQKRLDLMFAAPPPPTNNCYVENGVGSENDDGDLGNESTNKISNKEEPNIPMHSKYKESIPLYGNLALELAQTYHALARNSTDIRPSVDSLLSGRDGIVYINLHVAVKIEAAKELISNIPPRIPYFSHEPFLRFYHTLLFHPVSAAELLRHKMIKKSSSSKKDTRYDDPGSLRRFEKLLLVADDPFKSLNDIASETALPLQFVFDAATSLLEAGVCMALPVMTRSTRFGCSAKAVELMVSQRLNFAQQFGDLPIFMVVSALTTTIVKKGNHKTKEENIESKNEVKPKTLISIGEIIDYSKLVIRMFQSETVKSSESVHEDAMENIPSVIQSLIHRILNTARSTRLPPGLAGIKVNKTNRSQFVEKALISMITWLRTRSIIIEQKEFLASIMDWKEPELSVLRPTKKEGDDSKSFLLRDNESCYRYFTSHKYHSRGNVSTVALAWKYGVTLRYIEDFRDWGVKEKKLCSVIRASTEKDDWGAP